MNEPVREERVAAVANCPIDGAVTWAEGLRQHETLGEAGAFVRTCPGALILCVGASVNRGAGLSIQQEAALRDVPVGAVLRLYGL